MLADHESGIGIEYDLTHNPLICDASPIVFTPEAEWLVSTTATLVRVFGMLMLTSIVVIAILALASPLVIIGCNNVKTGVCGEYTYVADILMLGVYIMWYPMIVSAKISAVLGPASDPAIVWLWFVVMFAFASVCVVMKEVAQDDDDEDSEWVPPVML